MMNDINWLCDLKQKNHRGQKITGQYLEDSNFARNGIRRL